MMNLSEEKTYGISALEHNSKLPIGAVASNAIKPDYELAIPDVCEMFNVTRSSLEGWIVTGMIRFRIDGDMVYFLLAEITEDVKMARMHDSFRTGEERNAFLIGARLTPRMYSPSMHYTFKGKKNLQWLNEIKVIGKTNKG